MKSYSEKLKDPRWQKKRLQILIRDKWKCKKCGSAERTLHVHHLEYNADPWDANQKDLVTLCEICHHIVTKNEIINLDSITIFYLGLGKNHHDLMVFYVYNDSIFQSIYENGLETISLGYDCNSATKVKLFLHEAISKIILP